jgi:hypothetical protein
LLLRQPAEVYEMENKVKTREARKYVFRDLIEMVEVRRLERFVSGKSY